MVKCSESDRYSQYAGFCAAVVKKLFGSSMKAKKAMDRMQECTASGFREVLAALSSIGSSALADILLGDSDDVPVKFYDQDLGSI